MRTRMRIAIGIIGLGLGVDARGEASVEVRQYNQEYEPAGTYYRIQPGPRVRILATKPNETFEFEAGIWDNDTYLGLADIYEIVADENLGDVTITREGHDGRDYGARDVGEINISRFDLEGHITTRGRITSLVIAGNLGDEWRTSALNATSASLDIVGNLVKSVTVGADTAQGGAALFRVSGDILPEASATIWGGDHPQIAQIEQTQARSRANPRDQRHLGCSSVQRRN